MKLNKNLSKIWTKGEMIVYKNDENIIETEVIIHKYKDEIYKGWFNVFGSTYFKHFKKEEDKDWNKKIIMEEKLLIEKRFCGSINLFSAQKNNESVLMFLIENIRKEISIRREYYKSMLETYTYLMNDLKYDFNKKIFIEQTDKDKILKILEKNVGILLSEKELELLKSKNLEELKNHLFSLIRGKENYPFKDFILKELSSKETNYDFVYNCINIEDRLNSKEINITNDIKKVLIKDFIKLNDYISSMSFLDPKEITHYIEILLTLKSNNIISIEKNEIVKRILNYYFNNIETIKKNRNLYKLINEYIDKNMYLLKEEEIKNLIEYRIENNVRSESEYEYFYIINIINIPEFKQIVLNYFERTKEDIVNSISLISKIKDEKQKKESISLLIKNITYVSTNNIESELNLNDIEIEELRTIQDFFKRNKTIIEENKYYLFIKNFNIIIKNKIDQLNSKNIYDFINLLKHSNEKIEKELETKIMKLILNKTNEDYDRDFTLSTFASLNLSDEIQLYIFEKFINTISLISDSFDRHILKSLLMNVNLSQKIIKEKLFDKKDNYLIGLLLFNKNRKELLNDEQKKYVLDNIDTIVNQNFDGSGYRQILKKDEIIEDLKGDKMKKEENEKSLEKLLKN